MKTKALPILFMAVIVAASCSRENIVEGNDSNSGFKINVSVRQPETKAAIQLFNEQIFIENNSLILSVEESDLESQPEPDISGIQTKASPITDALFKKREFMLFMYESKAPTTLQDSSTIAYNSTKSEWLPKGELYLPLTDPWSNSVWAYVDYDEIVGDHSLTGSGSDVLQFTYDATKAANDSAVSTQDLLFAYDQFQSTDSPVQITLQFLHALAGIQFKVGDLGIDKGLELKEIELTNLYGKGTCSFDPDAATDSAKFIYSSISGKQSYKQKYDLTMSEYSTGKNFDTDSQNKRTFFVMPQLISDDAELKITFKVNGSTTRVLTKKLKDLYPKAYAAGKLYTYNISGGGEMGMEVKCEGVNNTYSVANTGFVKSFVRATIVGNWHFKSDNTIAFPWDGETSLTYNSTDWYKDGDFYYYKYAIEPACGVSPFPAKTYTEDLFDAATNKGTTHDASKYYLEIGVAVQMVRCADNLSGDGYLYYAKQAWGATTPGVLQLSKNVKP